MQDKQGLYVEAEVHDVSVFYHVFLAFYVQFTGFAYSGFGTVLDEIIVFDDFGADESFFEIGVNNTGTLRSFPAFVESPGTYFHLAGSEVGFQVQQLIGGTNQTAYT